MVAEHIPRRIAAEPKDCKSALPNPIIPCLKDKLSEAMMDVN